MEGTPNDPLITTLIEAFSNADLEALAGGAIVVAWIRAFEWAKKTIAGKEGRGWNVLRFVLSVLAVHRHTPQNGPSKAARQEK
ncbi:MAG: hypothetical protein ACR2RE_06775 [Geminicoccaceae bacterium]